MDAMNQPDAQAEPSKIISPQAAWPDAYREVYEQAASEDEAVSIFRRHGVSPRDAELFAGLAFSNSPHLLQALPTGR